MADMLNEMKFGISGPHNLLTDEVISISLSALGARVIQLSHSLCTQRRCSYGISWKTYTLIKSKCSLSTFQNRKTP